MIRRFTRLMFISLATIFIGWAVIAVVAEVVSRLRPPRGEMVDVGGHRLRLVCEGPRSARPVVWMEAGAFSGAADFAAIQQKLAAGGHRSCAYDRAGMGYSETGPGPRDGDAIVRDMSALMAASGETGPFILMGHSMAGLYLRQFAAANPDKVTGLVLLDAVTPELVGQPGVARFASRMETIARLGVAAGSVGLTKPLYWWGDRIGLPPQGKAEKRRGFISGRQNRAAYAEVESWQAAAAQALAAGALKPEWPVAVITASPSPSAVSRRFAGWAEMRLAPARGSRWPMIEAVQGADHRTLLGLTYGDRAVAGVDHVVRSLRAAAAGETAPASSAGG